MIHQLIKPAFSLFILTLPLWLVFRIILTRFKLTSFKREFLLLLFYVYMNCILLATVVPLPLTAHKTRIRNSINVIPVLTTLKGLIGTFSPEKRFLMHHALVNIIGNIALFIPLGIFLPLLSNNCFSIKRVIITAVVCSTFIEVSQLVLRAFGTFRYVDIDDIILNTVGAMCGFFLINTFSGKKISFDAKSHYKNQL
ncbi:MAG: VanZ-like protein [Segetibacter sp.]|nr:VanZ-like protein [Segetibacter sp.]